MPQLSIHQTITVVGISLNTLEKRRLTLAVKFVAKLISGKVDYSSLRLGLVLTYLSNVDTNDITRTAYMHVCIKPILA